MAKLTLPRLACRLLLFVFLMVLASLVILSFKASMMPEMLVAAPVTNSSVSSAGQTDPAMTPNNMETKLPPEQPSLKSTFPFSEIGKISRFFTDETTDQIQGQVNKVQDTNREAALSFMLTLAQEDKDSGIPSAEHLLTRQRANIIAELEEYKLHPSLGLSDVSKLIPELDGRPVRNMVLTTWRSGSTFLGDVLLAHPATYYHYEPLLDFGIRQLRSGDLADQAVNNLNNLLYCNYTGLEHYLEYGQDHSWLLSHNTRLWWICFAFRKFCEDPEFLSAFCNLFPYQSMKVVRLRMNLTEHFLLDDNLNVRVLMLVRDPRGTMQSRRHREWCPGNDDCENPERLCEDLVSDYHAALRLRERYPGRVRVIRYEDLSFNAHNLTRELYDFFRLSYVRQVDEFLESHTTLTKGGVSSTFRDSKVAPVHWKTDLMFEEVEDIQSHCHHALALYGYNLATDQQHLEQFDPIGHFSFPVT